MTFSDFETADEAERGGWGSGKAVMRGEAPPPRKPRWKIGATSCTCGGSWAWMQERPSGAWEMRGCVCHNRGPLRRARLSRERKPS